METRPLEVIFQRDKAYGVRNTGGYLCFMRKVSHYTGQDERYKAEIKETNDFARLIANAPQTLKQRDGLLTALKELVGCLSKEQGHYPNKGYFRLVSSYRKSAEQAIADCEVKC